MPAVDIFAEEMRVIVTNTNYANVFSEQATIKVYNAQMSQELSHNVVQG